MAKGSDSFRIEWIRTPQEAAQDVHRLGEALKASVYRGMVNAAPEAEEHMKETRPWADITGNARRGLKVEVTRETDTKTVATFFHQVGYGIYLELSHGGRYAVIVPTVYWSVPKFYESIVREALNAVRNF